MGGEFKKLHKQLNLDNIENGDLINTDIEEMRADISHMIEVYKWFVGYNNYFKIAEKHI